MRKSVLWALGLVVACLVALGLVVLSSAGEANGIRLHGDPYYFIKRQFAYLAAGILVAAAAAVFDYRKWREHWMLAALFGVAVFLLLWVVFKFPQVNGSYRWIRLGPVRLQPSELAKLAAVICVAVWVDKAAWRVELFMRGAFWPACFIALLALPILLEPDFGSVMVVSGAGMLVMLLAGTRIRHMLPFAALGLGVFVYKVATNANRMARILAFLGLEKGCVPAGIPGVGSDAASAAAEAAAYQSKMALVAIQNGGLWGVGLTRSMQKHYYLPEAHTDFIFAIGAEELGLLFSVAVVLLFMAFFALSLHIYSKASDRFGRLLVFGMAFIVFFQAMFNVGVVCDALPTKGMALPFFSYGGTNLLSSLFAVGTILSVGLHSCGDLKRDKARCAGGG